MKKLKKEEIKMNINEFITLIVAITFLTMIISFMLVGYISIRKQKKKKYYEELVKELREKIEKEMQG